MPPPQPHDVRATFDLLGRQKKELIWIGGTMQRSKDGYNWLGRHPQQTLDFLTSI